MKTMIEKEYKNWLSKFKGDRNFAKHYFLASKGAIRLRPSVINFTIQNQDLYNQLDNELRQMNKQQAYREYARRKREEAEEMAVEYDMSVFEPQKEVRLEDIPFSFILLTFFSYLII
ncbi:MAG: hypothetical protein WDA47_04235 [Bacilli bacterium]|jgi:hypothetical protein